MVSGMGLVCGLGTDLPGCIEAMFEGGQDPRLPARLGRYCAEGIPVFQLDDTALASLPSKEDLSASAALALKAVHEALAQSGWDLNDLRKLRVGVAMGATVGASLNFLDFYAVRREGADPELDIIKTYFASNPAERISRELGLSGPVICLTNACTSGADAIGAAIGWLEHDLCDVAIAGGCDALNAVTVTGFSRLMVASGEPCKPFDANRQGLNLGEGAGALILEKSDTDRLGLGRILGKVLAYGTQSDAYHLTAPQPDAVGLKGAIRVCLKKTGLAARDMAFINTHGTATKNNDLVEGLVLREGFEGVPFLSTKGYTGHTLGAAGAMEAVFTLHGLNSGRLPASRGFDKPDPEIGISPITRNTDISGDYAMSFSLAFGGNNSVLLMAGA